MILDDSTIVALATPSGIGAIAIVRLSGQKAYPIILALTHRASLTPRYAHVSTIYDKEGVAIEEAITLYFPAPHSYTTQDVCEIHCHGGSISAKTIIALCIALGARYAREGEFTKRAFLGGRIDLGQAQAVAALIQSHSLRANKILMRQLRGELNIFVEQIREKLLELLAFSEANIDYSEDLEEDYTHSMIAKLNLIQSKLEEVCCFSRTRQGLLEGYTLSIIGKPNVGKSSLLNALLAYDRAIVSEIEGTTRDTIEEHLYLNGLLIRLIDTAGIRQSKDSIEQIGIHRSKQAIERSDIIIAVFDSSRMLDHEDYAIIELIQTYKDKRFLIVFNKSDLPKCCDESKILALIQSHQNSIAPSPLYINTKIDGARIVLAHIESALEYNGGDSHPLLISNFQIESVQNALTCLKEADSKLQNGEIELFSYQIRDCIQHISHITYPYKDDELLDKLFGTFCLGK